MFMPISRSLFAQISLHFCSQDILTVNMAGNALLLCLLPRAAAMGEGWLCGLLSVLGAFQGISHYHLEPLSEKNKSLSHYYL